MEFELIPGQVQVSENGVQLIADHENVKVFEIDLISKYPGLIIGWSTGGRIGIDIFADENTLSAVHDAQATTFSLPLDSLTWTMMSTGSRYTVRVVAYRRMTDD